MDVLGVDRQSWAGDPAVLCPVCECKVDDGNGENSHPKGGANLSKPPIKIAHFL